MEDAHKDDLPLSSNFHEVQVHHFILDMSCSISEKVFDCVLTLFCTFTGNVNSITEASITDCAEDKLSSNTNIFAADINVTHDTGDSFWNNSNLIDSEINFNCDADIKLKNKTNSTEPVTVTYSTENNFMNNCHFVSPEINVNYETDKTFLSKTNTTAYETSITYNTENKIISKTNSAASEGNVTLNNEKNLLNSCSFTRSETNVAHNIDMLLGSNTNSIFVDTNITKNAQNLKQEKNSQNQFSSKVSVCLDSFALDISSCDLCQVVRESACVMTTDYDPSSEKSLRIPQAHMSYYHHLYKSLQSHKQEFLSLDFAVSKHNLLIHLQDKAAERDTVVLRICYRTLAEGPSLLWTVDQSGQPCVFTVGHLLNNRSLFPCQDLPHAMSTWHCAISLTDSHMDDVSVVMTGEGEPEICRNADGHRVFYFSSSYPMPASTFALAIGTWLVTRISNPSCVDNVDPARSAMPDCCLFSPACLHEQMVVQLGKYLPVCFEALSSILGPYPLKYLNLLIVPECFDSLGLACPHLILLSQSILCPDLSMMYRLSHEICHTWFGILTGPSDWTEEWLTEGICCYLEDIVHAAVMKWDEDESHERSTLRALLKFRILSSEVDNTSEDLQTLRPNMGLFTSTEATGTQQGFVKNGLNQEKTVMQVHYLKGFFLLRYLEGLAGRVVFLSALKKFTSLHLGELFSSQELLEYMFENCPILRTSELNVTQVCHEWLDTPGIPDQLKSLPSVVKSHLISQVKQEVSAIKAATSRKRTRGQSSSALAKETPTIEFEKLLPEQLVLLFEMLVEENVSVTVGQLRMLREKHKIPATNAEVQHSWCELVIHRKAVQWMSDVECFLRHHQALGVYLYGELLISGSKKLSDLAYKCFSSSGASMPEGPRTVVRSMLFPL